MKRHFWRLAGACLILLGLIGTAFARGHHLGHHPHAPELDPTLIVSALAFLGGAAMLVLERYRRR